MIRLDEDKCRDERKDTSGRDRSPGSRAEGSRERSRRGKLRFDRPSVPFSRRQVHHFDPMDKVDRAGASDNCPAEKTMDPLVDSDRTDDEAARADAPKIAAAPESSSPERERRRREASSRAGGCDTYLHHLDIGDAPSPGDMMTNSDAREIDSLRVHDFAFVLRGDGKSWTYAIVASRERDAIRFVVDAEGSTKNLSRDRWPTKVRPARRRRGEGAARTRSRSPLSVPPSRVIEGMPPPPFERDRGESRRGSVLSLFD